MKEEIKKLKKIELHLHLDGSVSLEVAKKISGLEINELRKKMIAPLETANLEEYLTKFAFPISLMQSKENLKLIAKDLALSLKKDNVIYAEVRFAPIMHTKNLTLNEVIESVLDGLKEVDIKTNLILCLKREVSDELNFQVVKIAQEYLGKGVGGIDIAGSEAEFRLKRYEKFFKYAKEHNIPFTIHVGEVDSKDIKEAIFLGAKRFGHGVKAIDSKNLINLIKENNILLEVCPTSNIQTHAFENYQDHPLYKLYKDNVNVSINTDNRTVSNITLNEEYYKLSENFDFTIEDFKKINENALNYAFLSSSEKLKLLEILKTDDKIS